jgi:hypothetical protein
VAPVAQDSDEAAQMCSPDAVFVVIPPEGLDNEALMGDLKKGVDKITQMGFMPILLLSKLDETSSDPIRENPSNPSERQKLKLAEAVNALGVRPDNAFILINYRSSTRQVELDRNIYRILYHVLVCARDRKEILQKRQKTYRSPTKVPFVSDVSTFLQGRSPLELLFGLFLLAVVRAYIHLVVPTAFVGLVGFFGFFASITTQHASQSGAAALSGTTSATSHPPSTREASAARSSAEAEGVTNSSAAAVRETMEGVLDGLSASFPDTDALIESDARCAEPAPPSFDSLGVDSSRVTLGIPVALSA